MSVGVPDACLAFSQILVRQLSREETIGGIETKGVMVSSKPILNEVQVARISGQVHGRTTHSLAEKMFDGSDAIRVTFSALTLMIHETAKVLNCKTVLEELSFDLESSS